MESVKPHCERVLQRSGAQSLPGRESGTLSPVRFAGKIREIAPLRAISRRLQAGFSAVQTAWRRGRDSYPRYRCYPVQRFSKTQVGSEPFGKFSNLLPFSTGYK